MCDLIGNLAQQMATSRVSALLGIPWGTVTSVARRVAERMLPGDRLDNLRRIAVDEFYWAEKDYVTVVWDHDTSRVVWVGEGKSGETLQRFFTELGDARCAAIELVTGDMSKAYLAAVKKELPAADFILDHFHVLRLAHDAVDEVRRQAVRDLRAAEDEVAAKAVKNSRYQLLANPENLTPEGASKIEDIKRNCRVLYRAYSLKEALAYVLECGSYTTAARELARLIKWMKLSRLEPFKKLGRTLKKNMGDILNSIRYRLSNGPLEGCNRKIRGLIYRAFGFRSKDNFIGAIYLCCSGVEVPSPLALPLCTN